jgi:hypothetical protein
MTMDTTTPFPQQLAATVATATPRVRAATHAERGAALTAATAEANQVAERERHRLQRELGTVDRLRANALAALEERAEAARRERAEVLLKKAFDTLPAFIAQWRAEPSRAATTAIRTMWAELDKIAQLEIGDELGSHVLAAVFIDQISASVGGSLTRLCSVLVGAGANSSVIEALSQFRRANDPSAAVAALERLESALLTVARRGAGSAVEPRHEELFALHKRNATRSDLIRAIEEHNEKWCKLDAESFAASYVAPPPMPSISTRVMQWLGGS